MKHFRTTLLSAAALVLWATGCTLQGSPRAQEKKSDVVSAQIKFDAVGEVFILPAVVPLEAWPEGPLVAIAGMSRYYISTGWSIGYDLLPGKTVLKDTDAFDLMSAHYASTSNIISENWPTALTNTQTYWRHSYYGIYGAHVITNPMGKNCIVGILHGENKNMKHYSDVNIVYDNTVMPARTFQFPQDYGGPDPNTGEWVENWSAYFAFIGMEYCPLDNDNGKSMAQQDIGPILWPAKGYLNSDHTQASGGLRHPSSIVHDGYLYVFYLDASCFKGDIRMARCRLDQLWTPGSFRNYYNGAFNEPSLPKGFHKEKREFFYVPGGRSTPLFPDVFINRFSVAKVKDTKWFIGVEERIEEKVWPDCPLYLRLSTDLVTWSQPFKIDYPYTPGIEPILPYCTFFNNTFTSNILIDANDFYIAGGRRIQKPANGKLPVLQMSLHIIE